MANEKAAILVMTASSDLRDSLGSILADAYNIITAEDLNKGLSMIVSSRPSICIIDFALANSDDGQAHNQLKKYKPDLVTLLVCPRNQKDALLESSLSSEVFRVILAPLSPGQTKLAVSAAIKLIESQGRQPQVLEAQFVSTQSLEKLEEEAPSGKTRNVQTAPTNQKAERKVPLPPAKPAVKEKTPSKKEPQNKERKKKTPSKKTPAPIRQTKESTKSFNLKPVLGIIALVAVSGLSWFFLKGDGSEKPAPQSKQAAIQQESIEAARQEKINELQTLAQAALLTNNRFPPTDGNAVDGYTEILEIDPDNQVAKSALQELSKQALGDLDLEISNGSVTEAKQSISTARNISEGRQYFSELVEALISEKKSTLIDSANIALLADNSTEASSYINIAKGLFGSEDPEINTISGSIQETLAEKNLSQEISRIVSNANRTLNTNNLLEPSQNNALYYINRLENMDQGNSNLGTLKSDLGKALIAEARKSTLAFDFVNAKRFIENAAAQGASDQAVSDERIRLSETESDYQEQQRAAAEAAQIAEQAEIDRLAEIARLAEISRLAEIERVAEKARQDKIKLLATPVEVQLSQLTSINRSAPDYPKRYEQRGLSGSATIGFTVNVDGSISNINVISVDPASATSFGTAAVKAVEEWSFQPFKDEEGNTRIARSQIKINFTY